MATLSKFTTPQIEIGEYVNVLTGFANNNAVVSNTLGQFIRANNFYNQADYPELYARIGIIGGTGTWRARTSGTSSAIFSATYGNGLYIFGTQSGGLSTSTDGKTWTTRTSGVATDINNLAYGNGLYVLSTGASIRSSTDGITWTARTSGTASTINRLIYANGQFVYVGNGGALGTSTDGVTWTSRTTSGTTLAIGGLTYGNGLYVYGVSGSIIRTSTDAITWSTATTTVGALSNLAYGNGLYVYIGIGTSGLLTSPDAVNWTVRNQSGMVWASFNIFYDNGVFIYGAQTGVIGWSLDGINWSNQPGGIGSVGDVRALAYGNGLYLIGGAGGILVTTTTGYVREVAPTYNSETQFYVPPYTMSAVGLTLPTFAANSNPQYVSYVRAK